jgi:hypothetical protein
MLRGGATSHSSILGGKFSFFAPACPLYIFLYISIASFQGTIFISPTLLAILSLRDTIISGTPGNLSLNALIVEDFITILPALHSTARKGPFPSEITISIFLFLYLQKKNRCSFL